MKTKLAGQVIGALGAFLIAVAQSHAQSISGAISFSGGAILNGPMATATGFVAYEGTIPASTPMVLPGSQTGDYAPVPPGLQATFFPFLFNPAPTPATPALLWSFQAGPPTDMLTYSFEITTLTISAQNPNFLNLAGTGIATITGGNSTFIPTPGTWTITDTTVGGTPTVTFGSDITVTPVPEPTSAVLALAGISSFGLARWFRRRS